MRLSQDTIFSTHQLAEYLADAALHDRRAFTAHVIAVNERRSRAVNPEQLIEKVVDILKQRRCDDAFCNIIADASRQSFQIANDVQKRRVFRKKMLLLVSRLDTVSQSAPKILASTHIRSERCFKLHDWLNKYPFLRQQAHVDHLSKRLDAAMPDVLEACRDAVPEMLEIRFHTYLQSLINSVARSEPVKASKSLALLWKEPDDKARDGLLQAWCGAPQVNAWEYYRLVAARCGETLTWDWLAARASAGDVTDLSIRQVSARGALPPAVMEALKAADDRVPEKQRSDAVFAYPADMAVTRPAGTWLYDTKTTTKADYRIEFAMRGNKVSRLLAGSPIRYAGVWVDGRVMPDEWDTHVVFDEIKHGEKTWWHCAGEAMAQALDARLSANGPGRRAVAHNRPYRSSGLRKSRNKSDDIRAYLLGEVESGWLKRFFAFARSAAPDILLPTAWQSDRFQPGRFLPPMLLRMPENAYDELMRDFRRSACRAAQLLRTLPRGNNCGVFGRFLLGLDSGGAASSPDGADSSLIQRLAHRVSDFTKSPEFPLPSAGMLSLALLQEFIETSRAGGKSPGALPPEDLRNELESLERALAYGMGIWDPSRSLIQIVSALKQLLHSVERLDSLPVFSKIAITEAGTIIATMPDGRAMTLFVQHCQEGHCHEGPLVYGTPVAPSQADTTLTNACGRCGALLCSALHGCRLGRQGEAPEDEPCLREELERLHLRPARHADVKFARQTAEEIAALFGDDFDTDG